MSFVLAALVSASSVSTCTPVVGADQLWRQSIRWIIVGEIHGTNETPDAFINLVCLAAETRRPVTVALELSSDGQPVIDAYLASDGGTQARASLLSLPNFTAEMQDGRGSGAFARLLERLRQMKMVGKVKQVIATDISASTPSAQDRNVAMARNWIAIPAPKNGVILTLVGNVHAMRTPITFGKRTIVPAGSLMPVDQTVTLNVIGNGGTTWNCQAEGCAAHANGPARQTGAGINYSKASDRRWDGVYELGVATTAAEPAIPRNATIQTPVAPETGIHRQF
jgi:hypothetical protein